MESPKIKILLEKYWSGNSNLDEEAELKRWYQNGIPESDKQYQLLFNYAETLQANKTEFDLDFLDETLLNQPKKLARYNKKSWVVSASIAASILVMVLSVSYQWRDIPMMTAVEEKTVTDDSIATAYEETLMALAFLSEKLNQGNASIYQLSSFDKATKKASDEHQ
jgi:hypothetical protein